MSEKLSEDKEGDIFDDVESLESDRGKNNNLKKNFLDDQEILSLTSHQNQRLIALGVIPQEQLLLEKTALLELPPKNHTVTIMSHHLGKKQSIVMNEEAQVKKEQAIEIHENPLPILQGAHSLAHDMKFGWKPEVAFESAPIPLYFNFIEQALVRYYQNQSYYDKGNRNHQPNKIIYYGPRFKDTYEMHKMFVRPAESTYEFAFPNFFGIGSAKEFYDSFFADEYDGEKPAKEEMREFTGMAPDVEWDELRFNSNFENGNLDMVVKTGENTYDLFLRADTNTKGHFGWFHFEVSRTKKGRTCHFNIVNMSKPDSLHMHGMQINYWSQKRNQPRFVGWERGGKDIRYAPSRLVKESLKYRRKYYSLSFSFTFESDDDKIWFAYTIPYTYSMLTQYIKAIGAEQRNSLEDERIQKQRYEQMRQQEDFDPNHPDVPRPRRWRGRYLQDHVLCKSLGGVDVPILTITNFEDPDWQKKKIVFVQGRLHPCETSSSWIVHGLISFLVSKSRVANELRKRLVFKIIPMCNPDGVIIGNTRTTLIGRDMNRQFPQGQNQNNQKQKPKEDDSDGEAPQIEESKLNPIPYAIRDHLHQTLKMNGAETDLTKPQHQHLNSDKIQSFWDIHQHSSKKSIFIYGPYYPLHSDKYLKIRLIPKLLSERSQMFRFYSCKFFRTDFQRGKENCARVTIGKQFNITNCFTLECSSYGYISKNSRATVQFREADLIEFGKNLAESVLEYALVTERDAKVKQGIRDRIKLRKSKTMRMVGGGGANTRKETTISSPAKQGETSNDARRLSRRKKSTEPLRYTGQVDENGNAVVENASDSAHLEEDDDSCYENDDDNGGGGPPIMVLSRDKRAAMLLASKQQQQIANEIISSGSGTVLQKADQLAFQEDPQMLQNIAKKVEPEESQSSSQEQEQQVKKIVQDLSNQLKQQPHPQPTYEFEPVIRYFSDEDFEDLEEDNISEEEEEDKDYEMCPVTKPFELRGLLKIKQKRSELDLNFYRQNPLQMQNAAGPQSIEEETEEEDQINQMEPQLPHQSEKLPSLILPQQQQSPSLVKRKVFVRKNRTMEQILSMIQTDIIQEEQIENEESNTYVSPRNNNNKPDSDSDDEGNEDDFLEDRDMKILRARILHAIEVFSKWNPHYNNRKEMLRHRRALKLSIENRSRASSKPSQKNGSESSNNGESGGNRQPQQSSLSPRKGLNQSTIKKNMHITSPQNSSKNVDKQQQMDIIDNFFKDFGIRGASGLTQQQLTLGFGPHTLALVGNRITSTKLSDLDDEVLSTISNEILRFNSSHKKKRKNILGTDEIIVGTAPGQGAIFQSPFKGSNSPQIQLSGHKNIINNLSNWHTNQTKLIDQQLSNILSLKLDNRARKIILQKFISQNPTAALNIKIDQYMQQSSSPSPQPFGKDKSPKHTNQSVMLNAGPSISAPSVHEDFRDQLRIPFQNSSLNQSRQQTQTPQVSNKILTLFGLRDRKTLSNASERDQHTPQPAKTPIKQSSTTTVKKKTNPHLVGFEANLDTLSQFITEKKNKMMKREVLSDFRIMSNSVLGDGRPARPQSSTNHYQIVKHQLARLYQNDGMIHAKKEPMQGFLNGVKPELHHPIPALKVRQEIELTNPSPILIHQALLNGEATQQLPANLKANACTDIQKKESMHILSQTTSLNRVSLLLSRQNSLLIQDSQRSQCSKDHTHSKKSISKSPHKRMNMLLMTAETKLGNQQVVVDSVNSERRSILSSQAKQNQLKLDHIIDGKQQVPEQKSLEKVQVPTIDKPVLRVRQQKVAKEAKKQSLLLNSSIDDMSHQISLYQWNKHLRHAKEYSNKQLMVKNQADNQLNLAATQHHSQLRGAYTKSVTPQDTQFESPHLFELSTKSSTIKSQLRKSLVFKKDNEQLASRASIEFTKKKLIEEFHQPAQSQYNNQPLNQDLVIKEPKTPGVLIHRPQTAVKLATHIRRKTAQSPLMPQQKAYLEYVQTHKSEIVKEIVIRAGEQKIMELCQKQL